MRYDSSSPRLLCFGIAPSLEKTSFMFKCAETDGDIRIEAFIQKAFKWYCKEMETTEDHGRYLYTLISSDKSTSSSVEEDQNGPIRK